jgi:SAM-dependent methyltransferase
MSRIERSLYPSFLLYALNHALLPLKLLIPQPVVSRISFFKTNAEIRIGIVGNMVRGRLLDVGCGGNRLVAEYRARGGSGTGIDIHPWTGVDMVVTDASRLPFADASFDTITFVACINHIVNRAEALIEARRLLAPGGQVLLTNLTPRLSRIWHAWAFWDPDQRQRGMAAGEVFGLTHAELMALATNAGFELAARHRFSWGLNSLYVLRAGAPFGDGERGD